MVLPSSLLEVVQRSCLMRVVWVPRGSWIASLTPKLQCIHELLAFPKIQFGLNGFRYDLQSYDGLLQGHSFTNFNCSPIDYNQNELHSYPLPNLNYIPPVWMPLSAQQLLSLTTSIGLDVPPPLCLPIYTSTSCLSLLTLPHAPIQK